MSQTEEPTDTLRQEKQRLRRAHRARIDAPDDIDNRTERSQRIADYIVEHLASLDRWTPNHTLLAYLSLAGEPDLRPLWSLPPTERPHLAAPRVNWKSRQMASALVRDLDRDTTTDWGPAGVALPSPASHCRPIPSREIAAVLIPGLAFDLAGARLGRGEGYYDRFLADLPEQTPRIGICFSQLVVETIPTEAHDVRVHTLITDETIHACHP